MSGDTRALKDALYALHGAARQKLLAAHAAQLALHDQQLPHLVNLIDHAEATDCAEIYISHIQAVAHLEVEAKAATDAATLAMVRTHLLIKSTMDAAEDELLSLIGESE